MTKITAALALQIAQANIPGLETLEMRNSDRLDFHDVTASAIARIIEAAYAAGQDSKKRRKPHAAVSIEFNTTSYEMAHGHKPRGRGTWAFFPTREQRIVDGIWSPSMTYSEAKRWARQRMVDAGKPVATLYVGS